MPVSYTHLRDVIGMSKQVIVGACEARCPSNTAEPEHRSTPDIGTQAEPVHEPRVDRRCRDARHGREEERVDVR